MPNRFICDVLDEMRASFDTYNFGNIKGLIEECQTLANRMEAGLYDKKDIRDMTAELRDLKREKSKLEFEIQDRKSELEDLIRKNKTEKSTIRERLKTNGSLPLKNQKHSEQK